LTAPAPTPGSILVYDRIGANKRTTWLLMTIFIVVAGSLATLIVLAVGAPIGFLGFVGIFLILYALISYYASTSVVLSISGAHEVTKEDGDQERELGRHVENLCIGAGLPMPRTWVLEDTAPNAFATGRDPQHSHVVVTRGLLNMMEPSELEGVLAHELSHIGNYDIRLMTVVTVLVGLIALLSDVFMRWTWFGAGSRRGSRDEGGNALALILLVVAILAAILAPIIAQTIKFAVSRRREYLADASGALLCRNPGALASALEKIAADQEPLEAANKATAHLYIENPLKQHGSFLNNLFDTHPPIEERIRLLRGM
jgi:heat shock protein HtpX